MIDFRDGETADTLGAFQFCKQVPSAQQADCIACISRNDPMNNSRELEGHANDYIYTAVGCLRTSSRGLAADLIRLMLGIGGGVALLTILAAAFTFSTSQGDSNKVKQAKEMMTAAVSGLLFIIFSIIILRFIGVTIIRIPGLS